MSRQKILSSALYLCPRHYKLLGHPLNFTSYTSHLQVNRAKEVLISTQTVWLFFSLGRTCPVVFQTQTCSFWCVNQQLKKNTQERFHGKPATREPGTTDSSREVTRVPAPFLRAPQGLEHRTLELFPDPAPPEGGLLALVGVQPSQTKLPFQKCVPRHLLY